VDQDPGKSSDPASRTPLSHLGSRAPSPTWRIIPLDSARGLLRTARLPPHPPPPPPRVAPDHRPPGDGGQLPVDGPLQHGQIRRPVRRPAGTCRLRAKRSIFALTPASPTPPPPDLCGSMEGARGHGRQGRWAPSPCPPACASRFNQASPAWSNRCRRKDEAGPPFFFSPAPDQREGLEAMALRVSDSTSTPSNSPRRLAALAAAPASWSWSWWIQSSPPEPSRQRGCRRAHFSSLGRVRGINARRRTLERARLEHYPGMTEAQD